MRSAKLFSLAVISALLLSACASANIEEETAPAATGRFESQVGLQLFMWPWESIAAECEQIGDSGIDWILTSPPQEHIQGDQWWTVYQPVSYQIESRFGTREQFSRMVESCSDSGVAVIADAVINHMSASPSGTGVAGTEFTKYGYPGLYSEEDFHDCGLTSNNQIQNYRDEQQVQTCELLGLSDLDQGREDVQQQILDYLNDLLDLGVSGFRIDAAKHIAAADLKAIVDQLPEETRIIHEVIRGGGEPIQPEQYLDSGDVWEFDYARSFKGYFKNEVITPAASPVRFRTYTPSGQTVSFVSNHDTERNGETLSYKDARYFELATAMMLAEDYGQPMLYSSYAFTSYDSGPAQSGSVVNPIDCQSTSAPQDSYSNLEWICQHRWESTLNMIKFRDRVGDAPVVEQTRKRGIYGFARENIGYFITNVFDKEAVDVEVATTLPDGEYIDLIDGKSVTITGGVLSTRLDPMSALALLVD